MDAFFPSASSSWGLLWVVDIEAMLLTLPYSKHNFYCWLYGRPLHQTINRRCHKLSPAMLVVFLAFVSTHTTAATTSFMARSCIFSSLLTTHYWYTYGSFLLYAFSTYRYVCIDYTYNLRLRRCSGRARNVFLKFYLVFRSLLLLRRYYQVCDFHSHPRIRDAGSLRYMSPSSCA